MSDEQKVPDRNHALNVIANDLSGLYGWLKLSTRYAAAHEALAVVERDLGLPVGDDLFPRRGPQLAPQPPPTVPAGAEVAQVLRELLDKIEEMQHTDWVINCDGPLFKRARAALLAATGARAVSSRPKCATCGHYPDRDPEPGVCEACECPNHAGARAAGGEQVEPMTITVTSDPSAPPPNVWAMGREMREAEVIERCAEAARKAKIRPWRDWSDIEEDDRERWRDVARAVLAAAPPTPSAPRVAELLAECRWRLDEGVGQPFMPSEIVRWLTPGGTDGGES